MSAPLLLSLPLLLGPSAAPAVGPPAVGPPAICHPVVIGDARSLPWDGHGGFTVAPDYDVAALVPDTLEVLDGTGDVLVHMETLRRAAIYVSGMGQRGERPEKSLRLARAEELCDALAARLASGRTLAERGALARRELGLRLFDLGYVLGALSQAGLDLDDRGLGCLREALGILEGEGAAHLGYALATWGTERRSARYEHLDRALARVEDREGCLGRSLLSTAGPILGCDSFDELAAEIRSASARG